jgi:2-haloacid dehalogenase
MKPIMSFDCYGTIIDWENGIWNAIRKIMEKRGIKESKEEILSLYAKIESHAEKEYRPYKEILKIVMREIGKELKIALNPEEEDALVNSIPFWPPFEDSKTALSKIKKYYKIAIISNVDNDIIDKTLKNLGIKFDYVVTAEMVEAYKPCLEVFEYAQELMDMDKSQWVHVAQSIYHDIIPAKRYEIKTVWIKRRGYGATPPSYEKPDFEFENLNELAYHIENNPQGFK